MRSFSGSRSLPRCRRPRIGLAILLMLPWVAHCDTGRPVAESTILSFVTAVQAEDLDSLFCLLTGASGDAVATEEGTDRDAFDAWARSRYEAYLRGRDDGEVDLGDDGIGLVKAFALGKGTFFTLSNVRRDDETMTVDTLVRFAYSRIDISDFPPGTVFYACALPMGRIHAIRVPFGRQRVTREVLETVRVRWNLVRSSATARCPEGWTVASVTALPETATESRVEWVF